MAEKPSPAIDGTKALAGRPGTVERMQSLQQRAERGEPLFQRGDSHTNGLTEDQLRGRQFSAGRVVEYTLAQELADFRKSMEDEK